MQPTQSPTPAPGPNSDVTLPSQPITSAAPHYKNILCIEDEHFISELYGRALQKAGYNVTVEVDGLKGLDIAKTNQYDIILLDIMVPNLTGVELLKRLRHDVPDLKAKVIVTTNLEQSEEDRAAVEKQADGYVIKANMTPKELVAFLQSLEK
jgi:DNA-binding response OmpR family regulator